jgi:hypothetical protein
MNVKFELDKTYGIGVRIGQDKPTGNYKWEKDTYFAKPATYFINDKKCPDTATYFMTNPDGLPSNRTYTIVDIGNNGKTNFVDEGTPEKYSSDSFSQPMSLGSLQQPLDTSKIGNTTSTPLNMPNSFGLELKTLTPENDNVPLLKYQIQMLTQQLDEFKRHNNGGGSNQYTSQMFDEFYRKGVDSASMTYQPIIDKKDLEIKYWKEKAMELQDEIRELIGDHNEALRQKEIEIRTCQLKHKDDLKSLEDKLDKEYEKITDETVKKELQGLKDNGMSSILGAVLPVLPSAIAEFRQLAAEMGWIKQKPGQNINIPAFPPSQPVMTPEQISKLRNQEVDAQFVTETTREVDNDELRS